MSRGAEGRTDRRAAMAAAGLLVANLLVVAIALYGNWAYYALLIAFWIELLIIGAFNVLRIVVVSAVGEPFGPRLAVSAATRILTAVLGAGFFTVKYGGIALGAGLLVLGAPAILASGSVDRGASLLAGIQAVGPGLGLAAAILAASHGLSFLLNFLGRGEYRRARLVGLIFLPYARVVAVVVVLYVGYLGTLAYPGFDRTTVFILVVMALKILVDLLSHRLEHARPRLEAAD